MLSFGISIFLSAFLLFLVQPLIAKMILPWFGGSAAVWTTCLMFFQVTLLAGYTYAHASIRFLRPKAQATLHLLLLVGSILALPILPGPGWKPPDGFHPVWRMLALLAATVGLPYFVLSTTGPLLQAWYARSRATATPYRLYALSNAGSLLALVAYPAIVEPQIRVHSQTYLWSAAYLVFAGLCGWVALIARRTIVLAGTGESSASPGEAPGFVLHLLWVGLAFCPATLLVAVTSHMTQNIAPVPLLWVAPLALYLVSFILTFAGERWYGRKLWFPLFVVAATLMLAFQFPDTRNASPKGVIPLFAASFFVCAVVCHGELYRLRPSPQWLTSFYLMISLGGALGGIFVGLLAPMLFNDYIELPVALFLTVLLVAWTLRRAPPSLPGPAARYVEYSLLAALACGLVYLLAGEHRRWSSQFVLMRRNFYSAVRVNDLGDTSDTEPIRELDHGTIVHGTEYTRVPFHRRPTTYYGPASGIGIALTDSPGTPPRTVGVVGLGTGTISAYARPEDTYRFYEINPMVVDIAEHQFFYLKECPAHWDVVLGDARLSLEREPLGKFDVLAVDAFSSDSIPVHLLTIEAFREYIDRLKPEGLLAVHVSNKHLDLAGIVTRAAREMGKAAVRVDSPDDDYLATYKADWILIAKDRSVFQRPEWKVSQRTKLPPAGDLWTDDYSNLFRILK